MYSLTPDRNIAPKKGRILLAEPYLNDPYFKRSVILLCEHNEEGSFGFVLNNYIEFDMDQIDENMPYLDSRVSIGGPVKKSNLFYLHQAGTALEESVEGAEGIFMGGDFGQLKEHLVKGTIKTADVRFFVGYAGWSPNQLMEELEQNSWIVTDADPQVLMDTHKEDLWTEVLKSMGPSFARLAELPEDPRMN